MEHKLKAVVSNKIDTNDIIRLGRRARNTVGGEINSYLDVWKNPFSDYSLCEVRKAFNSDIVPIPPNERDVVFMSQANYNKYAPDGYISLSSKKNTCIGSDPEFVILGKPKGNIENDVIIHAADVLAFEATIGSDGPLGELRAAPGITPKEHVNNLDELISNIYNELDPNIYKCKIIPYLNDKWAHLYEYTENHVIDKDMIVTCGGHIHFGLTSKIKSCNSSKIIISAIDRLIAICMHRVDMDMSNKRISKGGYGDLDDYRLDQVSLEYRGLSGTWLLYKDLATTVLSVTNSLVETMVAKISECFDDPNKNDWDIKRGCTALIDDVIDREKLIVELFPSLSHLFEAYSYLQLENMFIEDPNSTNVFEYINKSLECLDSIIDEPKLEPFSNLVTAEYDSYKNLDPNFIENWAAEISVFDHLNQ